MNAILKNKNNSCNVEIIWLQIVCGTDVPVRYSCDLRSSDDSTVLNTLIEYCKNIENKRLPLSLQFLQIVI